MDDSKLQQIGEMFLSEMIGNIETLTTAHSLTDPGYAEFLRYLSETVVEYVHAVKDDALSDIVANKDFQD